MPDKPHPPKKPAADKHWRLRQGYRQEADRKNPHPGVQVLDSRGRPREPKISHHSWISKWSP